MTPKEKAKELYLKFLPYDVELCDPLGDILVGEIERHAKRCCLIAVYEMVNVIAYIDGAAYNYWIQVKEEIEKL